MKKHSSSLLLIAASISLFSCSTSSSSATTTFDNYYSVFGTAAFRIILYEAKQENLDYLASYFQNLSDLTDAYNEPITVSANLYTINSTNKPVVVDDELRDILNFALDMQKETSGYFNPLIGRLTNLWKDGINGIIDGVQSDPLVPYIPSDAAIKEALDETNSSTLTVDGNTVTRTGKGIIDLGALAKGYSLREAESYLKKNGIESYLINGGTSSLAVGLTSDKKEWTVSFRDYSKAHFKCSATSIGTSSISEQGATIDGKNYSHIVNPFTGSAEASYVAATVKYDDPAICDVLSTVFMLVGEEGAKTYAAKYDGLAYSLYDGTNFVASDNLGVYYS